MFKRFFILFLGILITSAPAVALEFDVSVDEEIKKKYNSTKLESDILPNLPKVYSPSSSDIKTPQAPKSSLIYNQELPAITATTKDNSIKIPSGTKFQVKSNQLISDRIKEGSTVTFTSLSPVYKNTLQIPAGTKFYGVITNSHTPQATGNGGLVVIKITRMTLNGKTYPVNGKITKAHAKKIFFNNIKGKHQYAKGVSGQIQKGENFYKKSRTVAGKMADNPILVVLSPIPKITGFAGYTVCTVLSPLTGLMSKGGSLSIPAGSDFEIKLLDNAFI